MLLLRIFIFRWAKGKFPDAKRDVRWLSKQTLALRLAINFHDYVVAALDGKKNKIQAPAER